MRALSLSWKQQGETVGFVPTMGYLHAGHMSLVHLAKARCSRVIVSIFVNPTQFNDPQDFEKYPVDLARDSHLLMQEKVDALFCPTVEEMYGSLQAVSQTDGMNTWVQVAGLDSIFEGASRPGHFRGVATVVTKLFLTTMPDVAVFGEKDFQQLRIIEKLVSDLKFPVIVLRGPVQREQDGLAMSSRNVRLSPRARQAALSLSRGLFEANELFRRGEGETLVLCQCALELMSREDLVKPDYVAVVDEQTLASKHIVSPGDRMLVAAVVDGVRLIDNIELRR